MRGTGLYYDAEQREMQERDRELIPRPLLLWMGVLVAGALSLAGYSALSQKPHAGVPQPAEIVESRTFVLSGDSVAVSVVAPDGEVLLDSANGAFIAVVADGLRRVRTVNRTEGNPPVTLARLANGRLTLIDPATGWSAEMTSFGAGNARHWEVLFD
ncbi:photosynthetic complex assembly protein PuhC [Palleronia caenipelagi]|uniref:Photosynthetic complex assembly protein n=1 Tax=Palleronia caenipelagi TaxID=2489174 RepID=A0A547Q875_9RHOB|nr:photosynthetic complex assembly protein PuhC [Palleronia caenipelagi]TRD22584.1 photosynthetic complex assembly protein [Palleronia caenipelagi]